VAVAALPPLALEMFSIICVGRNQAADVWRTGRTRSLRAANKTKAATLKTVAAL
jgi:hypothetical protein